VCRPREFCSWIDIGIASRTSSRLRFGGVFCAVFLLCGGRVFAGREGVRDGGPGLWVEYKIKGAAHGLRQVVVCTSFFMVPRGLAMVPLPARDGLSG